MSFILFISHNEASEYVKVENLSFEDGLKAMILAKEELSDCNFLFTNCALTEERTVDIKKLLEGEE